MSPSRHDDDEDWPLAPEPEEDQPPAGKYLLAYQGGKRVFRFDRYNMELRFWIIDPTQWAKRNVVLYCALDHRGNISTRSNYYRLWVLANGGVPVRKSRMSPLVFKGYWWAELRKTRQRTMCAGVRPLRPDEVGCTVVANLIERAAGGRPR